MEEIEEKMKYFLTSLLFFAIHSLAGEMPEIPKGTNANKIWDNFCNASGTVARESIVIPEPNYNNSQVRSAATKLVEISPYSYYFYSGPLNAYKLTTYGPKDPTTGKSSRQLVAPPSEGPGKFRINDRTAKDFPVVESKTEKDPIIGRRNAHAFLVQLCGEFRDRPSLIEAKLNWVNKIYTLRDVPVKDFKTAGDVWRQLSAHSYAKYINITQKIFSAKERAAVYRKNKSVLTGEVFEEREGVKPFTVCETKYIMDQYVAGSYSLPMVSKNQKPKAKKAGGETDEEVYANEDYYSYMVGGVDLPEYIKDFRSFKKRKNACLPTEEDYFYDFRGDSNFKPNSPESNGMIWFSSSIGAACSRQANGKFILKTTMADQFKEDPEICEKYFKEPFKYRWSAARAGLAAWMMRDSKYDDYFSNSGSNVTIIPNLNPMEKPFSYKFVLQDEYEPELYLAFDKNEDGQLFTEKYLKNAETGQGEYVKIVLEGDELAEAIKENQAAEDQYKKDMAEYQKRMDARPKEEVLSQFVRQFEDKQKTFWKRSDLGFNEIFQVNKDPKHSTGDAYARIRDAVNRHTDWYASAYDDGSGKVRDQAYSPFVASSYEMSASDGFTSPGVTVNSPADGCKHWMFIFKLPLKNWMSYEKLQRGEQVDFNTQWFDETSMGTNHLADSERALDRMGTALEGEMDSILYLNNLTTSGKVDSKCGEDKVATFN
jgi:hypothetical protein